ncbi:MAG: nuclear transport factor 2 family protein [Planctomycetota bacterium]
MTAAEVAAKFYALVSEEKEAEAKQLWSDDVVSYESDPNSPFSVCRGREEVEKKHEWWYANAEIHEVKTEGPFVHGEQFAVIYEIDCTMKEFGRSRMSEIGLFTVADGKIIEERFFQTPMG